ncbi:MAG: transglycosylase SLT domain-containing protein [Bdellovibrionota bacterium]
MSGYTHVMFRRRRKKIRTFWFVLVLALLWPRPNQSQTGAADFAYSELDLPKRIEMISPYDDLIKKYSQKNGFDWRLIAALIYTESSFNHYAVSKVGAKGLMQLMPSVQKDLGIDNVFHPEQNIRAGVTYFRQLVGRVHGQSFEDQVSLALAAYNAGIGHLIDAQNVARKFGKDPYSWTVIKNIYLQLEDPTFESQGRRYGHVQGQSVVAYVDKIMSRYGRFRNELPEVPQIQL